MSPFGARTLFFFNDTATTEIYTLSLHDALPICVFDLSGRRSIFCRACFDRPRSKDRKSTRLNSSHHSISYAVFCLKKKHYYGELGRTLALVRSSECASSHVSDR